MFTQKMFAQQVAGDRLHLGALTDWGSTALRKSHVTFSKGCVPPQEQGYVLEVNRLGGVCRLDFGQGYSQCVNDLLREAKNKVVDKRRSF